MAIEKLLSCVIIDHDEAKDMVNRLNTQAKHAGLAFVAGEPTTPVSEDSDQSEEPYCDSSEVSEEAFIASENGMGSDDDFSEDSEDESDESEESSWS